MSLNPYDIWSPIYQDIDYDDFCENYFKNGINSNIKDFLNKYITILPSDIRISIFSIIDELSSPIFTPPKKIGIKLHKDNTKIDTDSFKKGLPIQYSYKGTFVHETN